MKTHHEIIITLPLICSSPNPEPSMLRSCSHHRSGHFHPQMHCDCWLSHALAEDSYWAEIILWLTPYFHKWFANPFDFRPPPRFITTAPHYWVGHWGKSLLQFVADAWKAGHIVMGQGSMQKMKTLSICSSVCVYVWVSCLYFSFSACVCLYTVFMTPALPEENQISEYSLADEGTFAHKSVLVKNNNNGLVSILHWAFPHVSDQRVSWTELCLIALYDCLCCRMYLLLFKHANERPWLSPPQLQGFSS